MKFREFKTILSEETIDVNTLTARNSNYYRNLVNLIKAGKEVQVTIAKTAKTPKIVKTVVFEPYAADILEKIWNPTGTDSKEVASEEQVALMKTTQLPAVDGSSYKITQIEKTADIKQKLGDTGEVTNSKWWNKGNVAEGIMACAVLTKFEKEGEIITGEDVFNTAQQIQGNTLSATAYGKAVQLKITLSSNDFRALKMSAQQPQEFLQYDKAKEIYQLYLDTATYVNQSSSVKSALEKIAAANPKDIIEITADGATAEAQHSTKADLWIAVGNKKERLLSIKTSTVKHIGAVSGYEFEHINNFFLSTVGFGLPDELRKGFKALPPGKMSKDERSKKIAEIRAYNYAHGTKKAYQYVFKRIKELTAGPVDQSDYDFVTTVANGVMHHATLGEEIRLVIISPKAKQAYQELEFGPQLFEALQNYDLVPFLNLEGANYKLLVYGYPKTEKAKRIQNDASMFVQFRSYVQDAAARNVVEIGGLLKNLTDVSKEEQTAATSFADVVAQGVPQPPAKASATKKAPQPQQPTQVQQPIAPQQPEPVELGPDDLTNFS